MTLDGRWFALAAAAAAVVVGAVRVSGSQVRTGFVAPKPIVTKISARITVDPDPSNPSADRSSVAFNAASWFLGATDGQIVELASIGWSRGEAADRVAQNLPGGSKTRAIIVILQNPRGFEVTVNEDEALLWLDDHRPKLAKKIRSMVGREGSPVRTILPSSLSQGKLKLLEWSEPKKVLTRSYAETNAMAALSRYSRAIGLSKVFFQYDGRGDVADFAFDVPLRTRVLPFDLQDRRDLVRISKNGRFVDPLWKVEIFDPIPGSDRFGQNTIWLERGERPTYIYGKSFRIQP
jgi:hypothetical protein